MSHIRFHFYVLTLTAAAVLLFSQCQKDGFITDSDAKLAFANDTLSFDTVFTTIGTATKSITLYNPHDQAIKVSQVYFKGDTRRFFRLNINGQTLNGNQDNSLQNIELWKSDSLHLFIDVNIDPNDSNTPFVVQDTIVFVTNGNEQYLTLLAWGQNAHFLGRNTPEGEHVAVTQDTTWTNDKPYVIFNGIIIDSLHTLTIDKGVRVHIYNYGSIVVKGNLVVNGDSWADTTQIVRFQGVRTENGQPEYVANDYLGGVLPDWQQESDYTDIPGQWNGILFFPGSTGNIKGAELRNGITGILGSKIFVENNTIFISQAPQINIENTVIRDMAWNGIQSLGADITMTNSMIFACGINNLKLTLSGNNQFTHNTFANFSSQHINHRDPICLLENGIAISETQNLTDTEAPFKANFYNCIIFGETTREEVISNSFSDATTPYEIGFNNCLFRTDVVQIDENLFSNCLFNPLATDTVFQRYFDFDFRLNDNSPAINKGSTNTPAPVLYDITNKARDSQPDIGACEF
ncbi:MAG: hypothetical protein JNM36_18630 [Chitinophagales bacterium]|nr:hypothetical protein [Chitinophagales bacterium]